MDDPGRHHAKWNEPEKGKCYIATRSHLESKKVESTEAESKRVVTSGRELGKMGDAGLGYKIAVKWDTF